MDYKQLIEQINLAHLNLQSQALRSVNQLLVLRNWLIGCYIVEFEQNGSDRAVYGEKLMPSLSKELQGKQLKGMSETNLKLFRSLFLTYPQIRQPLADLFQKDLYNSNLQIRQPLADEFVKEEYSVKPTEGINLLRHFSFRHFTELVKIHDPVKRKYYEQEAIKGNWGARELKRQIDSLLLERIGLSKDKETLLKKVNENTHPESIEETIKDPYIFEFTGFKELPIYSENDLETALLSKIQEFLLEMGNGFCFEARQKRITIGNEHDRIDLVFYHRILKCHVLIDLKIRDFSHADVGQMNYYLNYYAENMKGEEDNPPIGIILCTQKEHEKVKYATAGLDNKLFVSKYLVQLPKEEELLNLIKEYFFHFM